MNTDPLRDDVLPTTEIVFSKDELRFLRWTVRNAGTDALTPYEEAQRRVEAYTGKKAAHIGGHPWTYERPHSAEALRRILDGQRVVLTRPVCEQLQLLCTRISFELQGDPEKVDDVRGVMDGVMSKLMDAHERLSAAGPGDDSLAPYAGIPPDTDDTTSTTATDDGHDTDDTDDR